MIVPEILPGEIGAGYLIRLGNLNGYSSKEITIENIRKEFLSINEDKSLSISILLSRALGITSEQYCRLHTLLPTLRSVSTHLPYVKHGDLSHPELIKNSSPSTFGEAFNICESCRDEDLGYHGFTYYRREHQLPGFDFCSKHHQKLIQSDCEFNISSTHSHELPDATILRYRTILDSFASAETPIPHLHIIDLLQSKAKELEICWWPRGNKKLLSDLIFDAFPTNWLESLRIKVSKKRKGMYFTSIDSLLTTSNKISCGYLYALILSVLFDHADDALNAAYACIQLAPRVINKSKKTNHDIWHGKSLTLRKLYTESGGNATVIALKLGTTKRDVRDRLNKKGMLALGLTNKNMQLAFMDFQSGMGLMDSCLKHKVEVKVIEQMLRVSSSVQAEAFRSMISIRENI